MNPLNVFKGMALGCLFFFASQTQAAFTTIWASTGSQDNRGVAWADFNNDCLQDIILVNNQPGASVYVYRNDGGGGFTLVYTSTEADRCTGVSVADYDSDGSIDFAVSNYSNIPDKVYHNNGSFSFSVAWSSPYNEYSTGIDFGDFNNDGNPDLAINSGSASGVHLFQGDGAGAFTDVGFVTTSGNAASTRFGDYDADGFLDLFEGVTGWGSKIYKGNGTATFTLAHTLAWNNNGDSSWADFDQDSFLDLYQTSYPAIDRYAGGPFSPYWSNATSSQYGRAADYDRDGRPDIVHSQWAPSNLIVRHNEGGAIFNILSGPSASGGPVAWGDYDNDGDPDILGGCFQCGTNPARLYHNDTTGFPAGPCIPTTPTRIPTRTNTPTATPVLTATPSLSKTVSPTVTMSPTFSHSPTISPTFTISKTPTPTSTATLSPTFSHSSTISPSFTFSPTYSVSPTVTPTSALVAGCGAMPLGLNTSVSDSTSGEVNDFTSTCGSASGPDDLWYVSITQAGLFTVDTCTAGLYDTKLWLLNSCSPVSALGCNDDFCGVRSSISMVLVPGVYYVVVDGFGGSSGGYTLTTAFTPYTPTITPTFTISATITLTPVITFTATATASPAASSTVSQTPNPASLLNVAPSGSDHFIYQCEGNCVNLALNVDRPGSVQVRVWNLRGDLAGEYNAAATGNGVLVVPLETSHLAPGIFFYHVTIRYSDGSVKQLKPAKFMVKP